jgi:GNAT superfamily N-acetyltransferase
VVERPGPGVRRTTAGDRARAVGTLAAAFAGDPVVGFLVPPGSRNRDARLRRLFDLEVPRSGQPGDTWLTDDGGGAAVWFPPGPWQAGGAGSLRDLGGWVGVLQRRLPAAGRVRAAMERHHAQLPEHWYLSYLGVVPARQGRGIGSALLRGVLDTCDRDGVPAYLEATTERSRSLYARHGFADHGRLDLPDGCPPVHPMWRDPA